MLRGTYLAGNVPSVVEAPKGNAQNEGEEGQQRQGMLRRASSAKGAEYESQGQARSASPLVHESKLTQPCKGVIYFGPSGLMAYCVRRPGATRFALAPGFHIPRLWRCMIQSRRAERGLRPS